MRASTAAVVMIASGLALCGCDLDVVETHADTLAEYEDRGWLPAQLLPPSTHDIDLENNVDLNYSIGSFRFLPAEAGRFMQGVRSGVPPHSPFRHWRQIVADAREEGLSLWRYSEEGAEYAFFCDLSEARCEYWMWSIR